MKAASDLGLGFCGISLFYREGYFQQAVDHNNWQTEYYSRLEPRNLPIEPVVDAQGKPLVVSVPLPWSDVKLLAWRAECGSGAGLPARCQPPGQRTAFPRSHQTRYGGDTTTRIMQELILGVGGVRLLRALGMQPSTFHMNEATRRSSRWN